MIVVLSLVSCGILHFSSKYFEMIFLCHFVITTFFPITLLTQSVPINKTHYDCRKSNVSQWFGSVDMINTYLSSILQNIVHSDNNVMIFTDCLTGKDIGIASSISIAISNSKPSTNTISTKLFGGSKDIIVIDLPETEVENAAQNIYMAFLNERVSKWQPTIIILWKKLTTRMQQGYLLRKYFKELTLHLDSNIFVIFFEKSVPLSITPMSMAVWEMYAIKTKAVLSLVGHVSFEDQYQLINETSENNTECNSNTEFRKISSDHKMMLESIAKRRSNFHQEKLIAAVKYDDYFKDWTWTGLETKEDGTHMLNKTDGLVDVLYWDLKILMNFSASIIAGDTIYIHQNGTALGTTARLLKSGEADISLNYASFTISRAKAFLFLHPTYHSLIHVFFKQPPANSIRDIVIAAFAKELWITLMGVWAILLMSLQVRLLLLPKNISSTHSLQSSPSSTTEDYRFAKESVLWSVAIVCQKSWYLNPCSTTLRMKVILGSIVSLISYTAYSASIVSSLAVHKIPVKTFTDLISFKFIFTVHEKSEPFQTILRGLLQSFDLNQKVVTTSTVTEISHLITDSNSDLQSTRNAFLSAADMFYKTAATLNYSDIFICNHISSIPAGPTLHKSGTLVTKESQYKEVLNHMLIYLRERGMIRRYIQVYDTQHLLYCVNKDFESKLEPAVFNDVFTVMLVLCVGIPLALLVLTVETTYAYVN